MVLKSGKHGVRSGNTLRASKSRYNRHYRADSCIVRKTANLSRRQPCDEADDSLLDADGVLYSLNKKGRWGLPNIIKENIQHEHHDMKVSLCQRHKLSRKSNCIDFCCNKGQVKTVTAKHGYFNDSSVRDSGKKGKKKGKQTGDSQEVGEDGMPDPDPEITYDVFYPSPVTSSLSYNPKYIRNAELVVYDDGEVRVAGTFRKKRGRKQRVNIACDDSQSDVGEEYSSDDQQSEAEDTPLEETLTPEVMLVDILEAAERAQRLCAEKPKRTKLKKRKTGSESFEDEWIVVAGYEEDEAYETTEEGNIDSGSFEAYELPQTARLEALRVVLHCDAIQPHILQEKYGDRYMEADCRPRKFVIDTTEVVAKAMRSSVKHGVFIGALDLSSCVVFCRDASFDDDMDVYRVHLNINSSVNVIKLETLFDLMHTCVEDVLQAAAVYATFLPLDSFEKTEMAAVARSSEKIMFFNMIPVVNKWTVESVQLEYLKSDDGEYDVISDDDVRGAAAAIDEARNVKLPRPEFCNICFDEISTGVLESANATCLEQCGHWFCDECWKEHIRGKIQSGATALECPEHNCKTHIDDATVLSLASVKHFNLYQKIRKTNNVEISPNMKWCPNPKCGRVLKILNENQESATVNCACGKVICFKCLKDAHWPASCEQTSSYKHKLVKSGDDNFSLEDPLSVVVRGKYCPKCKRYIEKNGGCKYMECVCSYAFCWACLGNWNYGYHSSCQQKSDIVGTQKRVVRHIDSTIKKDEKSSFYKMAVLHRMHRKPQHVRALKSTANALSLTLRNLMSKGHEIGEKAISQEGSPVSATTVHDFIMEVVQLKLELHHVIEHTAVLLDQRHIRIQSRKLGHICKRLHYLCSQIGDNLSSKGRSELQRAVPTLSTLRRMARSGVAALVSVLAHVDAVIDDFEED